MAEKITVYQCPACTGPLHYDGKIGKLKCDYCGSTYTTQEIEKLYGAKNEQAAEADAAAQAKADEAEAAAASWGSDAAGNATGWGSDAAGNATGWGSDAAHMRAYNCTSCGAELICDDTTAATSCPYCGNNTVIPGKFDGVDRPDYVIPFKVDKKQAVSAFKDYYKGRKLLPGSFASDNHIEEIKGVYVPFWMFSGEIEGRASYDARRAEVRRSGNEEITRTEYFDVTREGQMRFEKIPVDASTKMPDDLMDSIEPFNYKELTPFKMEYMPGFLANKYDVSKADCRKRADERAVNSFRSELRNTVKGYTTVNVRQQSEKVTPEKADYGMLPVWLLSSRFQDQTYLFAMNGQSGKMIGDLPVSKAKLAAWVIGVFAVVFGLLYFLFFNQDGDSMLISAAIGFIVAAITGAVMTSSMKPVARSHSAHAYVAEDGSLRLRQHNDRYIRTMETRRRVENGGGGHSGGVHVGGPSGGHSGGFSGSFSGGRPGGGRPGGGRPGGPGRR